MDMVLGRRRPRVYVAGRFKERETIRAWARQALDDCEILASWLDSTQTAADHELPFFERQAWAQRCLREVSHCDVLVYVASDRPSIGRHVELGYALAAGKPILLVGERESTIFHSHPLVRACRPEDVRAAVATVFPAGLPIHG